MVVLLAIGLAACRARPPVPPIDTVLGDAHRLDLAGRQDAAIALYREVLDRDPRSYDAHYGLARALDLAGHYEEARQHFATAVALAPSGSREQTMRMLALSWVFAGNVDEAAKEYEQVYAARMASRNFAAAAEVANELGRLYLEFGQLDRADAWYRSGHEAAGQVPDRQAWQVALDDMRWAHALARIAARRGRAVDARREIAVVRHLLDQGGNKEQEVQYPYVVGYVDFYLGDYASALTELARADQKDPFILLLMAEASEQLHQPDRAKTYYEQVLASTSHAINNAIARPIARRKLS
jgi:tetratricopeptide (TPR) repeat protein